MSAICRLVGPGDEGDPDDEAVGVEFVPDADGDLEVNSWDDDGNRVELWIDRDEALQLRDALTDWLATR